MSSPASSTENLRPHRFIGPTLGKGKACEPCRARRVRCNGVHPACANCIEYKRDCLYLERSRPPSSTNALSVKLAELEQRFQVLSEARDSSAAVSVNRVTSNEWDKGLLRDEEITDSAPLFQANHDDRQPLDAHTSLRLKALALNDPWLLQCMGKEARDIMLRLYLRECYRYMVPVVPLNFMETVDHPDERQRPHPCIVNAMVLVALDIATAFPVQDVVNEAASRFVEFQIPETTPSSETLVASIQAHCTNALAHADRLLDYIQAEALLALWYLRNGRFSQGHYTMGSACRMAISSNIHQIDENILKEGILSPGSALTTSSCWDGSLLGRPTGMPELARRISVFWQTFYGDKAASLMTGLPSTYDGSQDSRITTPWPRCPEEYATGTAFNVPYSSYEHLFDGRDVVLGVRECPWALVFKGMALLDRAVKMASLPSVDNDTGESVDLLQDAIRKLGSSYTALCEDPERFHIGAWTRPESVHRVIWSSLVQLLVLSASIYATYVTPGDGSSQDQYAIGRERLKCAHLSAVLVRNTSEHLDTLAGTVDPEHSNPGIAHLCVTTGHQLAAALNVVVEEIRILEERWKNAGDDDHLRQVMKREMEVEEANLDTLLDAIDHVRETYSVVGV